MRFFEKQRPEVYLHTVKLRREKKTGRRLWQFTLIVTFNVQLAESCDVPVAKAWQYITENDSAAAEVLILSEVLGCAIDFYAQIDDAEPALHLEGVDLAGLRMTRDKQIVEFWFSGEHENNSRLHAFMKEYAYTRCWAQFSPQQAELPMQPGAKEKASRAVVKAIDNLVAPLRTGGITSMSLKVEGHKEVVITKEDAERIHRKVKGK